MGPISVDLEGFFITMATHLNISKNDPRVIFLPVLSFPLMYDSPRSLLSFQEDKDFPF